jgi:hypothetical protein
MAAAWWIFARRAKGTCGTTSLWPTPGTIAGALTTTEAGLVALDSRAVRVCDGEIVWLSRDVLLHLVNQYIVTPVVVDRGKAVTPPSFHIWKTRYGV